jgi:hypothetical protein
VATTMSSIERTLLSLQHKTPDRVPVSQPNFMVTARMMNPPSFADFFKYRFFPRGGFGYCGQGSEVHRVQDGDTAAIPPNIAHSQVAAPGYTMIYVWAIRHLEGDRFGGDSRIFEPEHTWVLGS